MEAIRPNSYISFFTVIFCSIVVVAIGSPPIPKFSTPFLDVAPAVQGSDSNDQTFNWPASTPYYFYSFGAGLEHSPTLAVSYPAISTPVTRDSFMLTSAQNATVTFYLLDANDASPLIQDLWANPSERCPEVDCPDSDQFCAQPACPDEIRTNVLNRIIGVSYAESVTLAPSDVLTIVGNSLTGVGVTIEVDHADESSTTIDSIELPLYLSTLLIPKNVVRVLPESSAGFTVSQTKIITKKGVAILSSFEATAMDETDSASESANAESVTPSDDSEINPMVVYKRCGCVNQIFLPDLGEATTFALPSGGIPLNLTQEMQNEGNQYGSNSGVTVSQHVWTPGPGILSGQLQDLESSVAQFINDNDNGCPIQIFGHSLGAVAGLTLANTGASGVNVCQMLLYDPPLNHLPPFWSSQDKQNLIDTSNGAVGGDGTQASGLTTVYHGAGDHLAGYYPPLFPAWSDGNISTRQTLRTDLDNGMKNCNQRCTNSTGTGKIASGSAAASASAQ